MQQQLAAGSEEAFREVYLGYWNKIYSLALTYLKSPEAAQDIVQEVFLKIWKKRELLASVEDLESYIYITGRNEVINSFKKISKTGISDAADVPDDIMLPDTATQVKELRQQLLKAINRLPPQQLQIFKLTREQGLSHEEIAQQLGISKATVKNHMVRALNTLRQYLRDHPELIIAGIIWACRK